MVVLPGLRSTLFSPVVVLIAFSAGFRMFHPMFFFSASCDALTRVGKRVWGPACEALVGGRWSRGGEEERRRG